MPRTPVAVCLVYAGGSEVGAAFAALRPERTPCGWPCGAAGFQLGCTLSGRPSRKQFPSKKTPQFLVVGSGNAPLRLCGVPCLSAVLGLVPNCSSTGNGC